jgi:hypothetical protein
MINNSHAFQAFGALRRLNHIAAALRLGGRGVYVVFRLIDRAFFTQPICQLRQRRANHFVLALLKKTPVHHFIVPVGLRKHVVPSGGVENPQRRLENFARRDPFGRLSGMWSPVNGFRIRGHCSLVTRNTYLALPV